MLTPSPRLTITVTGLIAVLVALTCIQTALSLPWTGLHWQTTDDGLVIAQVAPDGPNAGLLPGTRVTHFHAGDVDIAATPVLLIEEPDVLPLYEEYNQLMDHSWLMDTAAEVGVLDITTADGERLTLDVAARTLATLPGLFWLQLLFGLVGAMTGAVVWSMRPRSTPTLLYFMTGIGYLIFAPAAAIYSTRELLIDGELFRTLSIINHFGALFFTASLTSLLWHYPLRLGRLPVASLCYLVAGAAWLADTFQLTPSTALFHLSVLGVFALSFVFAFFQWLGTRQKPSERAALRWFLLSIYLATGLFAGVIILPAALGTPPPASQGVMFGAFLIMYFGLALGVSRYRLFQLERWWVSIWAWFVSGVAIIVVDLLLVSFLSLSKPFALSLAVALVGWLYFPLRQWVWSRLARRRGDTLENWLNQAVPPLMAAGQVEQLSDALRQALGAVFDPLDTSRQSGLVDGPTVTDNGLCLLVPDAVDRSTLRLHHADRGARLFTSRDVHTAALVLSMYRLTEESLNAHEQGVRSERNRIRQDIHDDLGAKLLTLLHRAQSGDQQSLIREAIRDLRDLLNSMESAALSLDEALLQWEEEARQRCQAGSVALDWQARLDNPEREMDPARISHLARIIREAVSNALRHASPRSVRIDVQEQDGNLCLMIENDGVEAHDNRPGGRGLSIIQTRSQRLGGSADIRRDGERWRVQVEVPVAPASTGT